MADHAPYVVNVYFMIVESGETHHVPFYFKQRAKALAFYKACCFCENVPQVANNFGYTYRP